MLLIKWTKDKITSKTLDSLIDLYENNKDKDLEDIFKSKSEALKELYSLVEDKVFQYILNSNMDIDSKKEALYNKKIYKHIKYLLIDDPTVNTMRMKFGIKNSNDVMHHILNFSKYGNNQGCGCLLCKLKNEAYYANKRLLSIESQLRVVNSLDNLIEQSKKRTQKEQIELLKKRDTRRKILTIDPFSNELFHKKGLVLLKSLKKAKENKKEYTKVIIDHSLPVSTIEDRIYSIKNHLLKEVEKWSNKVYSINNTIKKAKETLWLP
jgi:hypothetical protein